MKIADQELSKTSFPIFPARIIETKRIQNKIDFSFEDTILKSQTSPSIRIFLNINPTSQTNSPSFDELLVLNAFKFELKRVNLKSIAVPELLFNFWLTIKNELLSLPIINCAFEIGDNEKFKLTLIFKNEKVLNLTKDFSLKDDNLNKVFYSFFNQDNLIAYDEIDVFNLLKGFKNYLNS